MNDTVVINLLVCPAHKAVPDEEDPYLGIAGYDENFIYCFCYKCQKFVTFSLLDMILMGKVGGQKCS